MCYSFFINKKIQRMKSQQVVISPADLWGQNLHQLARRDEGGRAAAGCGPGFLGDLQPLENSWENDRWYTVMAIEVAIKWL